MNRAARLFLLLALLLLLAACASTPDQRIQQNWSLFNSLPVAAQVRIRAGQIDLGFTPDMVRLALGDPQRILTRRTPAGDTTVWLYFDIDRRYDRQRANFDGLSLHGASGTRSAGGSAWINVMQEREYLRTRVEFASGVVFAYEEMVPEPSRR